MNDKPTRRDLMKPVQLLGLAFIAAVFAGGVTAVSLGVFQTLPADEVQRALIIGLIVAGVTFIHVLAFVDFVAGRSRPGHEAGRPTAARAAGGRTARGSRGAGRPRGPSRLRPVAPEGRLRQTRRGSIIVMPAGAAVSMRGSISAASSSPTIRSTRSCGRSTPRAMRSSISG